MNFLEYYQQLAKPSWAPPAAVFGPVWTVLYLIIAITFAAVFYKVFKGQLPLIVALPFALNLVFNLAFTPIQFGLKNNTLALIDIILVLATLLWAFYLTYVYSLKGSIESGAPSLGWIIYVNIPYLLWVIFATALQASITFLNRR